jgi:HK97 family phage major capsid protein
MTNLATQIQALVEERGQKIDSLGKLVETMSKEKRDFNEAEQKSYDETKKEVESITKRIDVLKEQLEREKETVRFIPGAPNSDTGAGEKTEKEKMYKRWTWKKALQIGTVRGARREGVEAELDVEERKVMQECGVSELSSESIVVPAAVMGKQRRDMDATTATAAPNNEGSFTIQTNVEGIVDVFLPEMVIGRLPVMRMNNLRGNVQFPQAQTLPSAGWNTENGTATEKTPKLAKLNLSPKRLAAYIQLSNQLLQQSEANISAFARRFLVGASAIEFEKAVLKGAGSNEPTGILGSTSNYTRIHAGDAANSAVNANGARAVWADWVKLVSTIKTANAPDGQAYITSPAMKGRAQITPRQSSGVEGNFILRDWNSGVNGFPVYATTNLPDTFTKGGSTVLSAIIFGDFSNLVVASWGGMEIGIDPYVNMKEALTNVVLNSYVDCGVLNPAAFAAGVDFQSY